MQKRGNNQKDVRSEPGEENRRKKRKKRQHSSASTKSTKKKFVHLAFSPPPPPLPLPRPSPQPGACFIGWSRVNSKTSTIKQGNEIGVNTSSAGSTSIVPDEKRSSTQASQKQSQKHECNSSTPKSGKKEEVESTPASSETTDVGILKRQYTDAIDSSAGPVAGAHDKKNIIMFQSLWVYILIWLTCLNILTMNLSITNGSSSSLAMFDMLCQDNPEFDHAACAFLPGGVSKSRHKEVMALFTSAADPTGKNKSWTIKGKVVMENGCVYAWLGALLSLMVSELYRQPSSAFWRRSLMHMYRGAMFLLLGGITSVSLGVIQTVGLSGISPWLALTQIELVTWSFALIFQQVNKSSTKNES